MSQSVDAKLAPEYLFKQFWAAASLEPRPQVPSKLSPQGFYGPPPALAKSHRVLALPQTPRFEVRYTLNRRMLSSFEKFPLYRLSALIVEKRTEITAGYIHAFKVGPLVDLSLMQSLTGAGGAASADLGCALATMVSSHVTPSELLSHGLHAKALVHIEMFEVGQRFRGKGLGTRAISALMAHLEPLHQVSLLTYRPYPCQFLNTHVLGCERSHDPAAVEAYQSFIGAAASLSQHYARQWGGQRLPGSDYFICSIGPSFSFAFNAPLQQWALLPNS